MRALHKPVTKIRIKVCFLLTALCTQNSDIKGSYKIRFRLRLNHSTLIFVDDLINSGYIQLFITLLTEERTELHEHILSALLAIIKNNENAISECRKEKYGLQSIISNHLQQIEKIDEAMVRFYSDEINFAPST